MKNQPEKKDLGEAGLFGFMNAVQQQEKTIDIPSAIDIPLANKIDSYYSKDVKIKRLTQKERVYRWIQDYPGCSQREISEGTGIARHLVPDRVQQLTKTSRVEIAGAMPDQLSKKTVTTYRVYTPTESKNISLKNSSYGTE